MQRLTKCCKVFFLVVLTILPSLSPDENKTKTIFSFPSKYRRHLWTGFDLMSSTTKQSLYTSVMISDVTKGYATR